MRNSKCKAFLWARSREPENQRYWFHFNSLLVLLKHSFGQEDIIASKSKYSWNIWNLVACVYKHRLAMSLIMKPTTLFTFFFVLFLELLSLNSKVQTTCSIYCTHLQMQKKKINRLPDFPLSLSFSLASLWLSSCCIPCWLVL